MALQVETVVAAAQDSSFNSGRNYYTDEPVYIKNLNGQYADIFDPSNNAIQILQDGFANRTDENGEFSFAIEAGEYIIEIRGLQRRETYVGADYFNNRIEDSISEITQRTLDSRGFKVVGDFSAGFEYTDYNQVGTYNDGLGNPDSVTTWIYTGAGAPNKTVPAGTVPSDPDYTQVFYKSHKDLTDTGAVGVHDDIYIREKNISDIIAEDAPIGTRYRATDLGDARYDVVGNSDIGGFYYTTMVSGRKLRLIPQDGIVNARNVGAKDLVDFDFNPMFKYCVQNNLTVSFYGCNCLTSTPIDVSQEQNRILKIVGDIEDKNNTAIYNLVSTTLGVAIKCKEIIHNRFGLAGTLSIIDAIPAANTGIEASESVTHIDSCLRNFNTHYKRTGGFYHTVGGGTLRRGRVLYDITGVPMYNAKFNATHSDFQTGILATGGNGPAVLEGSWEKFTNAVFESTTTASVFGIHLNGCYIENYPDEDVASGLTSVDGKYKSPSAFISGDGTLTGFARISCNGITGHVFDLDQPKCIDITIGLIDQGIGSLPQTIFSANGCRNYTIKTSIDDGSFPSVNMVSSGLSNSLQSMGSYQDFDAKVKCPTITRTNELSNGWSASEGVDITANSGVVNLAARLNASAATSSTCFNLIETRLRPEKNLRFNGTSNDPSNPVVEVRVLTNGDILILNTDGSTPTAGAVNFSLTYCI